MRAVVQRVASSSVTVDEQKISNIEKGLLVLLGVTHEDTSKDVDYLIEKIVNLRIFEDEDEKMNLSLKDINGELIVVCNLHYTETAKKAEGLTLQERLSQI